MRFTGKAKEQFEKWYKKSYLPNCNRELIKGTDVNYFKLLTSEMQWGVIQDFADVLENEKEIVLIPRVSKGWDCYFITIKGNMRKFNTRPEARTEAIKQLNEYLNKTL